MSEHYDIIVVGSGPGGGARPHRRAPTGCGLALFRLREPELGELRTYGGLLFVVFEKKQTRRRRR